VRSSGQAEQFIPEQMGRSKEGARILRLPLE
jgi:hypothetical protein